MTQGVNEVNDFMSPAVLAMNIIRHIGDHVSKSGSPISQISDITHVFGGQNAVFTEQVFVELSEKKGLIQIGRSLKANPGYSQFLQCQPHS